MLGYSGSFAGVTCAGTEGVEEKPNPANSPGGADEGAYDASAVVP